MPGDAERGRAGLDAARRRECVVGGPAAAPHQLGIPPVMGSGARPGCLRRRTAPFRAPSRPGTPPAPPLARPPELLLLLLLLSLQPGPQPRVASW